MHATKNWNCGVQWATQKQTPKVLPRNKRVDYHGNARTSASGKRYEVKRGETPSKRLEKMSVQVGLKETLARFQGLARISWEGPGKLGVWMEEQGGGDGGGWAEPQLLGRQVQEGQPLGPLDTGSWRSALFPLTPPRTSHHHRRPLRVGARADTGCQTLHHPHLRHPSLAFSFARLHARACARA